MPATANWWPVPSRWNFSIQRQVARSLTVMLGYVGSRGIDNAMRVGDANMVIPGFTPQGLLWPCAGQFLFSPIRALSDFNVGRTFMLSGSWELPFARMRWYGGWQLGTIFTLSDGLPFTAIISGDALGQANQNSFDVPNRLNNPGCGRPVNRGNPVQYINLGCFAFANPSTLFGNAGRNELVGPGVVNGDVSMFKNIPFNFMREGARLQIRVEAFNLPNRANFAAPLTNNKLFDTKGNPVNFAGQITSLQTPGRVIQLGLKLLW